MPAPIATCEPEAGGLLEPMSMRTVLTTWLDPVSNITRIELSYCQSISALKFELLWVTFEDTLKIQSDLCVATVNICQSYKPVNQTNSGIFPLTEEWPMTHSVSMDSNVQSSQPVLTLMHRLPLCLSAALHNCNNSTLNSCRCSTYH